MAGGGDSKYDNRDRDEIIAIRRSMDTRLGISETEKEILLLLHRIIQILKK